MGTKLYKKSKGNIFVQKPDQAPFVMMKHYVIDVWLPLLGPYAITILLVLQRFEREKGKGQGKLVQDLTIQELSAACGMSNKTFSHHANVLKNYGFIQIKTPNEQDRKRGVSTIYKLLTPPPVLPAKAIQQLSGKSPENYQIIAHWLLEEDSSNQEVNWDSLDPEFAEENEPTDVDLHHISAKSTSRWMQNNTNIEEYLEENIEEKYYPEFPYTEIPDDADSDLLDTDFVDPANDDGIAGQNTTRTDVTADQEAITKKNSMNRDEYATRANQHDVANKTELPRVAQVMIRVLQQVNGKQQPKLTATQLANLTTIPISLKSGEQMEFTVAELHAKYPQDFEAFVETIPAVLTEFQKRFTVNNMIKHMRGYDWLKIGFLAYMERKGNFGLPHAPSPAQNDTLLTYANTGGSSYYSPPERFLDPDEYVDD